MNVQGKKEVEQEETLTRLTHDDANMRLQRIQLVEDKHGQKTWELDAKAVQQYQGQNMILLEDVRVTLYTKDGRSLILSGNKGKIYPDSKNMELVGDVLLTSSDGYRLKTHSVSYQHAERRVVTADPVEIEGKELHMEGTGMRVDMEAKTIKILSQAKTRWKGGEGG